jgi:hypothetical protein
MTNSLVASKTSRFRGIRDIHAHPYFSEVDWTRLREQRAPFVPELDSETDACYFDDFSNEDDMAKYKEVHEKQNALKNMADREEKMNKGLFVGFTFRYVVSCFMASPPRLPHLSIRSPLLIAELNYD